MADFFCGRILNLRFDAVFAEDAENFSELSFGGIVVDGSFAVVSVNVNVEDARQSEQTFFDGLSGVSGVASGGELQTGGAGIFAAAAFFAHKIISNRADFTAWTNFEQAPRGDFSAVQILAHTKNISFKIAAADFGELIQNFGGNVVEIFFLHEKRYLVEGNVEQRFRPAQQKNPLVRFVPRENNFLQVALKFFHQLVQ